MALGSHHATLPTHSLGAFHPWLLRWALVPRAHHFHDYHAFSSPVTMRSHPLANTRCERGRLAPESGTPVFACKVTATTFEFLDPDAPRIHPLRVLLGTAVPAPPVP